jgi:hypothetical protein
MTDTNIQFTQTPRNSAAGFSKQKLKFDSQESSYYTKWQWSGLFFEFYYLANHRRYNFFSVPSREGYNSGRFIMSYMGWD